MDAAVPPITTVQLTRNDSKHVTVQLKYDKDPNVLSLKDTFHASKSQPSVSNLIKHQRFFLHRIAHDPEFARRIVSGESSTQQPPLVPLVDKLWRAPLPPPTTTCSDKERRMLAALLPQVQRLCTGAAQSRKTMHAQWMHAALEYAALLHEVGTLETMLIQFIALEMGVSFESYTIAAKEYARFLLKYADRSTEHADRSTEHADRSTEYADRSTEYADRSTEYADRSIKYARVVGKYNARVAKLQLLKDRLESESETTNPPQEIVITCPPADQDGLSVYAKKCVAWITEVSRKWMADLLDHEDRLHVSHLTLHV